MHQISAYDLSKNIGVLGQPGESQAVPEVAGEFDELVNWCDSFANIVHGIVGMLHDDARLAEAPANEAWEISGKAPGESKADLHQVLAIIEQMQGIIGQLEHVAQSTNPETGPPPDGARSTD